jgi:hypothetical protein
MNSNEAETNNKLIVKLPSLYFHDQANYRFSDQGGFCMLLRTVLLVTFYFKMLSNFKE